jgi:hypothetical protein
MASSRCSVQGSNSSPETRTRSRSRVRLGPESGPGSEPESPHPGGHMVPLSVQRRTVTQAVAGGPTLAREPRH